VAKKVPVAVVPAGDGLLRVNYQKLGLQLRIG
jgi:hypothetical protein